MAYYKQENATLVTLKRGNYKGWTEITEEEYNAIIASRAITEDARKKEADKT